MGNHSDTLARSSFALSSAPGRHAVIKPPRLPHKGKLPRWCPTWKHAAAGYIATAGITLAILAGTAGGSSASVPPPARHPGIMAPASAPASTAPAPSSSPAPPVPAVTRYTARPGDTLWGIAVRQCGTAADVSTLARANKISGGQLRIGESIVITC
jgi:LysM repeat protein